MSKPILLTEPQWCKLKNRLTNDYTPSVMMIGWKCREVLGFTVRNHREWSSKRGYTSDIRLDFYNEPKRTMFLLKYGEYLYDSDRFSSW